MAESKEFDSQDIARVKDLQGKFMATVAQIGQVEVEIRLLGERLKALELQRDTLWEKYRNTQTEEKNLVNELTEKYGDGVLDLDSNTFTPSE
jgi:chromosome segregation ATPase